MTPVEYMTWVAMTIRTHAWMCDVYEAELHQVASWLASGEPPRRAVPEDHAPARVSQRRPREPRRPHLVACPLRRAPRSGLRPQPHRGTIDSTGEVCSVPDRNRHVSYRLGSGVLLRHSARCW
jgi:hypothetical protein